MKGYLLLTLIVGLTLWSISAVGQTQKLKEDFPTYDQIKTSKDDIIDYGGPVSVIKTERKVINLFDYPSGTVTYIVNGKSSTDVNYIKQLLAGEGKDIEAISIGKPDEKGKRVIKIDYNLR